MHKAFWDWSHFPTKAVSPLLGHNDCFNNEHMTQEAVQKQLKEMLDLSKVTA